MIHNWGLVEFQTSQEAEDTFQILQGQTLQDQPIRVQYCIPGVHAINIYMAFVNDPMDAVQERKALLDETPSSKVYEQLNALAKQNPWFVANLQTIMASSAMTNPVPFCTSIKTGSGTGSNSMASADPAQAALILFLAGQVSKGPTEQTNHLLQGIVKQMTNGVKASEILRTILPASNPSHNEADLIQTAINMAGTNSNNSPNTSTSTTVVASSTSSTVVSSSSMSPPSVTSSLSPNNEPAKTARSDKCPLLMEMLYKSFQAKLAKEQRLKLALKEQQQQNSLKSSLKISSSSMTSSNSPCTSNMTKAGSNSYSVSSVPSSLASSTVNNNNQAATVVSPPNFANFANLQNNHVASTHNASMAASEAALAAAMMQTTPFLFSPDQLLTVQAAPAPQQVPQQTVPAYPNFPANSQLASYFPYYSQMINPAAAAAGLWSFPATPTHHQATPTLIHQTTPNEAAQLMIPNVMQYNHVGVKRAAAPVMYANVEKRMKLA